MDKMKNNIRENIIEAAQKIVMRYGFQKTTMDEIAYAIRKEKARCIIINLIKGGRFSVCNGEKNK